MKLVKGDNGDEELRAALLRKIEAKMPPAFGMFKQAQRVEQSDADQGRLDL